VDFVWLVRYINRLNFYEIRGSITGSGKERNSQLSPERICGPHSLLFSGYRQLFYRLVKRSEREADDSPPFSAEVSAWSCVSTHPYAFIN
jgi:hypothetical protein